MMSTLCAVLPTFADEVRTMIGNRLDEPETPPYLVLSAYARNLIRLLEANDRIQLTRAFAAIESLLVDGDEYVREAATIGLLESMQNRSLHRTTTPVQFLPFLGNESQRCW